MPHQFSNKYILKIFSPMAINVQCISLTREQLHFSYWFVWWSLYNLINILGHFSIILHQWDLRKVEFVDVSSAHETARKIRRILQSSGFQLEFESFKAYSLYNEFSKVGIVFCLTWYIKLLQWRSHRGEWGVWTPHFSKKWFMRFIQKCNKTFSGGLSQINHFCHVI